ncbi:MAG: pyruvate, phosphate dikinase [Deltaproteobacteria bacterium]|nr:pyruvate, phosphate dikinase [Deltaproteobacteria bacterium]
MARHVYSFGAGKATGRANMREVLGGKGAGLHEMTRMGVPVPPGFTISTAVCSHFYDHQGSYPEGLEAEVARAMARVEKTMGRRFGDGDNPLLVSVRSGARESMPGMMDTVLNLGLNDRTVAGMIRRTGNPRLVYDSYRRFVQMYGDVVLGMKPAKADAHDVFETLLERKKRARDVRDDTGLAAEDLQDLVTQFKDEVRLQRGVPFPEDPLEQLWGAIGAVFGSWNNDRAVAYRKMYGIPDGWGTAVNVQTMVFGNMGETSGTGVAFTRDPASGERRFYGEFLMNAQGEDVVAGIRTPQPIEALAKVQRSAYRELQRIGRVLEERYRDMQDMEFTIEDGRLWVLQTRTGKRTGFAAVRIAVDMADAGVISREEALQRIEPDHLSQVLRPVFDQAVKEGAAREGRVLARGLPAGPGAATGRIVFHAADAEEWRRRGDKVILCRVETSPEDIRGIEAAEGILTARGGMTSHAALVARQLGTVCVVGCEALSVDYRAGEARIGGAVLKEGEWLSLDGSTGEVIRGQLLTHPSDVLRVLLDRNRKAAGSANYRRFAKLMRWVDATRRLGVKTNADLPEQARISRDFGAGGIGLCRTEHMFFQEQRIDSVREMILADDEEGRRKALAKLLPMQKGDFKAILGIMDKLPVTIRLLDPPLHEFLPHTDADVASMAKVLSISPKTVREKVEALKEFNPMLGHRGCRLAISFPEITEMQTEAIFQAACELRKERKDPRPEVMIPLVGSLEEFRAQREIVERVARETMLGCGVEVRYAVGTMIELPRACLVADEIAREAQFFSFGTNDLTQTCLGLSRDDAGRFLPRYVAQGLLPEDPFVSIDEPGVGALMALGVQKGRSTREDLDVGICGEHGGDPKSVVFCHDLGLDYVSCSPYRVPIAKLAAAQAAIRKKSGR